MEEEIRQWVAENVGGAEVVSVTAVYPLTGAVKPIDQAKSGWPVTVLVRYGDGSTGQVKGAVGSGGGFIPTSIPKTPAAAAPSPQRVPKTSAPDEWIVPGQPSGVAIPGTAPTPEVPEPPEGTDWAGGVPIAVGGRSITGDPESQISTIENEIDNQLWRIKQLQAGASDPESGGSPTDLSNAQARLNDLVRARVQIAEKNKLVLRPVSLTAGDPSRMTASGVLGMGGEAGVSTNGGGYVGATLGGGNYTSGGTPGGGGGSYSSTAQAAADRYGHDLQMQANAAKIAQQQLEQEYQNKVRYLKQEISLKMPQAQAQAELDLWTAQATAKWQSYERQKEAADAYNRELPQRQYELERASASDRRAEEASYRQGKQQKLDVLGEQSQRAQAMVMESVNLGVAPGVLVKGAYDPQRRAMELINEQFKSTAAPPPKLTPMGTPQAPVTQPMPDLSQYAPAAPGAPAMLAPAAPIPEEEELLAAGRR